MEDDMYKGMFIPKGSFVFGNIWAMLRDERVYPQPESFLPERFSPTDIDGGVAPPDPRTYVFGFGRRRCPGKDLIESSLWLLMASIIATTDVGLPAEGVPEITFDNAVFRTPSPFGVDLRPRSARAAALIAEEYNA
jgi:cytochrome P450